VFYNQSDWWRAGNGYCLKYRGDKCHVVVKSDRCYATYHGDVAPALIALDAVAEIVGPGGARALPLAALFVEDGARRLTLEPGEWLAAVVVPPAAGWRADYAKARVRDAVDFPLAGAAVALRRDGDRLVGLRVAITGTNSAPLVVPTDGVVGGAWDAEAAKALAKAVQGTSNVLATTVASVKYRRRMLQALVRRLVDDLWNRA
jgi:4-hydroxybenzoyl-CoA reductase subunit beta